MRKWNKGFIIVLILIIAYPICYKLSKYKGPQAHEKIAGIMFHSENIHSGITLSNTTDSILIVKCVYLFRGETTQWIKTLKPHEECSEGGRVIQKAFYIGDNNYINVSDLNWN